MKKKYIADLFITKIWYLLMGGIAILYFIAFFIPFLFQPVSILATCVLLLTIIDYSMLFFAKGKITAERIISVQFSLGDENKVTLVFTNMLPFKVKAQIIDELPVQMQDRNFVRNIILNYNEQSELNYSIRPLTRGEYSFGHILCYVSSPLNLLRRRFKLEEPATVKVYPSYHQLKKYQLLATSDSLFTGIKKVRRLGHSQEFEKIKDYVQGDDMRTINWKATARSNNLMVNMYTDARQQQIYCLIDKSRAMKMPFDGMTLLDYSINASLTLLNIALLKQDKAGLITFSNKVNDIIAADRRGTQLSHIIETLYKQQTEFKESDYESLLATLHRKITQRSLIVLFTNFETISSLERQIPYLKRLANKHLLCVVFFQNTLLKKVLESTPDNIEGIYVKTIAGHFDLEKRQMVKELRRLGILSILTTPQTLTVDVINKYLELKARQMA